MKKRIGAFVLAALMLCVIAGRAAFTRSFYHAQAEALNCIDTPEQGITVIEEEGRLVFSPEKATAGLVFYPGGCVEAESYAPLMEALAVRGILCVIEKMPLGLAILDMDAAKGVQADFPQIKRWYLAGHSLGGYAASTYLGEAHEQYDGLILLAAYTQTDLTDTALDTLTIYGSEDGVLNMERYVQGLALLPEGYVEKVIDGGCHAYFGAYGEQRGDGAAAITREMQTEITAEAVAGFINERRKVASRRDDG